jgi:hypothetical protein
VKFGEEQQQRLAAALLSALLDSGAAVLKVERGVARERIVAIIRRELEGEQDLDREAELLLAAHLKNAPPGVDRHKLLQMIRKRLADERGEGR